MIKLPTPKAGGPYNIDIRANETKRINGVLIGEVWICSGQSNMEMPVEGWANDPIKNSSDEIANANYPSIRLFTVQKDVAFNPREDVNGSWSVCAPASVRSFSATAYFFAKELYERLKVPIGLIHTSWGGTIAEAWTSEAALRTMGDFDNELNTIDSVGKNIKAIMLKDSISNLSWQKALSQVHNQKVSSLDNDGWKVMQLPTVWEDAGYPDLDAIVWFKRTVQIPESWAGKDLKIDLGPIDDRDITYFNSEFLDSTMGGFSWAAERHYTIPGKLVKAGANTISVCVIDDCGNGGLYGMKEKMKIYPATENASTGIGLDGEWQYKIVAAKPKQVLNTWPNQPSVLYNGMISPLIPFSIRGAIWYQGESNVGRAKQYTKLFPLMIRDWRKRWNVGAFPFTLFRLHRLLTWAIILRPLLCATLNAAP
ncbi:sialate O-acetylesterase [Niabella ginsengisoli]|uniref:Sialate O-acetylesterase domain-containing protein n=1 Tax=Niabella ginsengisoli TaxID=522298 RepID=A0ABS9SDQ7_9BACT|nr:sialate O-acetylesterase [Niabella ginsengisoli]MCH5596466.1 hypothetical protein [Niabella ginsengisoli]